MSVISISAVEADRMIKNGATLIDIREADEHKRQHIRCAHHYALSTLQVRKPHMSGPIVFHCKGGNRTSANAERLLNSINEDRIYLMKGGIDAWQSAGFPTRTDTRQPIEIMRQVQVGAGTMVMAGLMLGAFVHPSLYGLAAIAGIGLTFSGVTGFCGMGRLLKLAPWNRNAQIASQ